MSCFLNGTKTKTYQISPNTRSVSNVVKKFGNKRLCSNKNNKIYKTKFDTKTPSHPMVTTTSFVGPNEKKEKGSFLSGDLVQIQTQLVESTVKTMPSGNIVYLIEDNTDYDEDNDFGGGWTKIDYPENLPRDQKSASDYLTARDKEFYASLKNSKT